MLENNNITDIQPLVNNVELGINLDTLDIGENQLSNIIPLFYLRNMKSLLLNNNYLLSINALSNLYTNYIK